MQPTIGNDVAHAAKLLQAGQVVAFATETVYGLGAVATNSSAVAAMYALKNRPPTHPCILHLADFAQAAHWAEIPEVAKKLAARFMPGPLTLLLPYKKNASIIAIDAIDDVIGIRIPAHPLAHDLLTRVGTGIFAPSANRFGGVSPTIAVHVANEFPNNDLYILDGGSCEVGLESTIVSCISGQVAVMRPGMISEDDIIKTTGCKLSPPPMFATPGRLAVHYAPHKPLLLVNEKELLQADATAAVLSTTKPSQVPFTQWRQSADTPANYARQLYALLHELDATDAACIMVQNPPNTTAWHAVQDRLSRAASK